MKMWHVIVCALFAVACTAGAGGGAIWAVIAGVIGAAAFVVACTSPNNDDPNVQACLSIIEPMPDAGDMNDQTRDMGSEDVYIGPCLTPLPPDLGPAPSDVGPDATDGGSDASSTDMAPRDMMEMGAAPERREILDRLRDRLPSDVAERIDQDDDFA